MYAYQQQKPVKTRNLHIVKNKNIKIVRHTKKKKNLIVECLRFIVVIAFLLSFAYFVLPVSYSRLIKNVFFPNIIPINISEQYNMAKADFSKAVEADMYSITNPVTNYLSNDLFMNRLLLTPTIQKTHSEVTTM